MIRLPLLLATCASLTLAPVAAGHVRVAPGSLAAGRANDVTITVPNPHASRVREIVATVAGARVQRPVDVAPGGSGTLVVRVPATEAGTLALRVEQRFEDGTEESEVVELRVGAEGAGALGQAAIAGGVLALLVAAAVLVRRRARLSES